VGLVEAGVAEDAGEAGEAVAEPRVRTFSQHKALPTCVSDPNSFFTDPDPGFFPIMIRIPDP